MSGVYKLINFSLFVAFAALLAVLAHRVLNPPEVGASLLAERLQDAPAANRQQPPAARAAGRPAVARDFSSYSRVVDENLFASDRRPYVETAGVIEEPVVDEPPPMDDTPLELPAGLRLTGVFRAGATRLAFFNESAVRSVAVGGRAPQAPGAAAPSRLQQRLLEQQARDRAAKIQSALQNAGVHAPGLDAGGAEAKPDGPKHGYREGEEIQGLYIEEIRETEVVLSKDGLRAALPLTSEVRVLAPASPAGRIQPPGQPPQVRQQPRQPGRQPQMRPDQRPPRERPNLRRQQRRPQRDSRRQPEPDDIVPADGDFYPDESYGDYEDDGSFEDEYYEDEYYEDEPPRQRRSTALAEE
jgi:hypothetical protein